MAEIRVGKNETLDSALRRFKRSCQKAGVLSEVRKREHYEKTECTEKEKIRSSTETEVQSIIVNVRRVIPCLLRTNFFRT